jgi:hypothetical protein
MRRALPYLLVGMTLCAPSPAAERRSWTKIRYIGGTVSIKTSPYDYNTKLTVSANPDGIVITIAPGKLFTAEQTLRIKPSQVVSLSSGPAAWRHVADVPGAQLPPRQPSLFGFMQDRALAAIVFDTDSGKREAVLLETLYWYEFMPALARLTGKDIEASR